MKVTFIYCAVGIAGFNDNRPDGDREGAWIGHGVASVAASTIKAGHDVNLIDLRRISGFEKLLKIIKKDPADVYGISVAPVDYPYALQTVLTIKKEFPDCKIIIGGIHPSIFPEEYSFKVIDTVVIGEGEVTFPKLLEDVNNLPRTITGEKPDLDLIPWVKRELFDYQAELKCNFTPDQRCPSITMIAGRGCPYHCNYCQPAENAVFGKPYRMRSARDVVAEMLHLKIIYDYKSVTFWDDTFTVSKKWVNEFCDRYERLQIKVPIAACSRADIICDNEPMVKRLAEIGLNCFVIGMESGSQRLLDMVKKGTTVEQNITAGKICKKYGIKIFATYMYGLPTETKEESTATYNMINKIRPEFPSPFWFIPIKGTGIYDICEKQDLIIDKERPIARTGIFCPTIKNINYEHIANLMGIGNHG